ncbi:uncharacterized protein [Danio rerio]|uniref:Uncharacterized protein n=1 Tax=Danio rerio TaxID=7955 RepID=A0AC58IXT7_DANRE
MVCPVTPTFTTVRPISPASTTVCPIIPASTTVRPIAPAPTTVRPIVSAPTTVCSFPPAPSTVCPIAPPPTAPGVVKPISGPGSLFGTLVFNPDMSVSMVIPSFAAPTSSAVPASPAPAVPPPAPAVPPPAPAPPGLLFLCPVTPRGTGADGNRRRKVESTKGSMCVRLLLMFAANVGNPRLRSLAIADLVMPHFACKLQMANP